jgi:hypothetical protein
MTDTTQSRISPARKHQLNALCHEVEALRFRLLEAQAQIHPADRRSSRKEEHEALEAAIIDLADVGYDLQFFVASATTVTGL